MPVPQPYSRALMWVDNVIIFRMASATARARSTFLGSESQSFARSSKFIMSAPSFQCLFYLCQEPVGGGAVENAMVEHEREIYHRADGDRVVDYYHPLLQRADPKDTALRLVDDRECKQRPTDAVIGKSERPALDVVWLQLFRACPVCQVVDRARHRQQGQIVGVFNYGHDQTFLAQGGSHAKVNGFMYQDTFVGPRGVDMRVCLQPGDERQHEIGGEGEVDSITGECIFVSRAMPDHVAHIRFHHGQHVRRSLLGQGHVLGDLLSDYRVLDQLVAYGFNDDRRRTMDHRLWSMVYGPLSILHIIQDIVF